MSLRDRIKRMTTGSFLRDVATLSLGTVGGRLISLAALPIVTRLYTPEDFSLLAVYLALVTTIAVAACLRLEIAIPLADSDDDAVRLLGLSLLAALGVGAVTLIVALVAPVAIASMLGRPQLAPYLWLVPLGIIMTASYSVLQYWATRARRFGSIARTRITQAAIGAATMLGLGWFGLAPLGLLIGNMFNIGAGGFRLGAEAIARDRDRLRLVSWQGMRATFHKFRRYPIYSTPESLANVAGVQIPVILIAALAGAEAGFLFLAMQVMTAPMSLLGSSISQVYMSRAPEELRAGRLAPFTLGIMKQLVQVGVGPLIFVGLVAPVVFPWIFGPDWARAGVIVAWLVPWMALQFITSPVSMVMYVTSRQRAMLVLTILGFFLRVGGVLISYLAFPDYLILGFVMGSIANYICAGIWITHAAGFSRAHYFDLFSSLFHWSIPSWIVLGSLMAWLINI